MLSLYSSILSTSCCLFTAKRYNYHKVQKELTKIDKDACLCFRFCFESGYSTPVRTDNGVSIPNFHDISEIERSLASLPKIRFLLLRFSAVSDCWIKLS